MKKQIKIDESRLKINPFVGALNIEVTRVNNANAANIVDGNLHPISYDVERQQCVKLFYCDLDFRKRMFKLSSNAQRMLLFILYNLQQGQDWIYINRDRYMRLNDISSINTVKKGISELWDNGFICPTSAYPNDVYWINPAIFFSGSRIAKYPTKITVKSTVIR